MPKIFLTPQVQQAIWTQYQKDSPKPGQEFTAWCIAQSEVMGVSKTLVQRCVAREQQAFDHQVAQARATTAQRVAQQLDMSMVRVLRTIGDGLVATRREVLYDEQVVQVEEPEDFTEEHDRTVTGEHGYEDTGTRKKKGTRKRWIKIRKPMVREDGSFEYFEQADWRARLTSTQQLIDVLGMTAPEQVNVQVDQNVNVRNLSQEKLQDEILKLGERMRSLGLTGVQPEADGRGDGAAGSGRPLVLVDGVYQDEGRAGHNGRSLQTVSEEALHRATAKRPRKRAGAVHREEPNNDGVVDGERLGGVADVHPAGDGGSVPV